MNKKNSKQSLVKRLKNRISWLENIVVRCSNYIEQLENESKELKQKYFELKKDHSGLIDWYWKAQDLLEENRKLKNENKRLKKSNDALKLLLKDIVQELDKSKIINSAQNLEKEFNKKLGFRWSEPCQAELDYMREMRQQENENQDKKKEETELKSELRKIITQRLRKHNLDIKV